MSEISTCIAAPPSVFRAGMVRVLDEAERTRPSLLDGGVLNAERDLEAGGCDVLVLDAFGREWAHLLAKLEQSGIRPNRVLLVEEVRSPTHAAGLLALNVAGCVGATDTPDVLVEKVVAVAEGDWRQSRRDLFEAMRRVQEPGVAEPSLSPHDLETLGLVAEGFSNRRIAEKLHLAEGTARNRVSFLYGKIGVRSRAEAILWAWRHGIVPEREGGRIS